MNVCMIPYQHYFDSTTKKQSNNINNTILTAFYTHIDEFLSVKKLSSWERREQRPVIKQE